MDEAGKQAVARVETEVEPQTEEVLDREDDVPHEVATPQETDR